ncbi:MAG: phosphoglycerate kinase [Candidatus Pacearchaeota archaeon]
MPEMKNKTVLLRCDLNSGLVNNKLKSSERIKASAETIKDLKRQKAKIVILAHQGRPGKDDFISLEQHAKRLSRYTKVEFVKDTTGKKAKEAIKNLKPGKAILLENIRKESDEFNPNKKSNSIVKNLVPLADAYMNDAFSICHREQTSITRLPRELPSYIGKTMQKELKALEKTNLKNATYILGGAKPEDNINLLKENKVLTGGLFGPLCLIAKGYNLGKEEEVLKDKQKLVPQLKKKLNKNVIMQKDFGIRTKESGKEKRKEISLEDLPSQKRLLDIGEKTIQEHEKHIKKAKSIYIKGPMGYYKDTKFNKGTSRILKAIARSKAYSIIGGGDLTEALKKTKINKNNFDHVSLAGGALLNYIAGEKLPGLEALKNKKEE